MGGGTGVPPVLTSTDRRDVGPTRPLYRYGPLAPFVDQTDARKRGVPRPTGRDDAAPAAEEPRSRRRRRASPVAPVDSGAWRPGPRSPRPGRGRGRENWYADSAPQGNSM